MTAPLASLASQEEVRDLVVELLRAFTAELRPHQARLPITPRTSLERELGLDSLARVELQRRLEQHCGVRLGEQAVAGAETVHELIRAVLAAEPAPQAASRLRVAMPVGGVQEFPREAQTLVEVLDWHAERHPDRTQIWLYGDDEQVEELTFGSLLADAETVAAGLLARGLEPQQAVALMLPTCRDFFAGFFGILLAGGVPVPLYPPVRPSQVEEHLRRQAGILRTAKAPLLITVPQAQRLARFLRSQVPTLRELPTVEELSRHGRHRGRPDLRPEDTGFLQFTSGSTGNPKGVVLSHANLLANMRVIGEFVDPTPDDVFVSWLPLYHDMGLIGAVFTTFYHRVPLVLMSPLQFLLRPERWLWAIHRHRGSLSAAPNFAYELCVKKVPDEAIAGLDLSSWRMSLNGAEPISTQAMNRFAQRFAAFGLRPQVMTPTYGLAENSLALTMTPLARLPKVDRVARARFAQEGWAQPSEAGDALEFVSCGTPLRGHEVRIVDPQGRELGERREGRLQFRGPSSTLGYFRNPAASARLLVGEGWLDSGDLAYVAEGEVYLTGRLKDVIIRAGRNIYPHEVEEAVGELEGVRKGCVVVFGSRSERDQTEELVVLAETRETEPARRTALEARVRQVATDLLGSPPDVIVLAPPRTVLKTSSGKVRRAACRELYEQGRIGEQGGAVWVQLARMSLAGWAHDLRQGARRAAETAYAGHFWSVFASCWGLNWVLVAGLPPGLRWRSSAFWARAVLRLGGVPHRITGLEHLPAQGPFVLVSNHQSYLDGMLLPVVSPRELATVVKRELEENPITRVLLRRLGAIFVERFDRSASTADARQVPDALAGGRPVAIFPEGTCLRMPGLLPFHMGAFVAAAEAGVPVIPMTIRGTRNLLRPDTWFPRRARVEVELGAPIQPEGSGWSEAVALRDRARAAILAACGEPDLGGEDVRSRLVPE